MTSLAEIKAAAEAAARIRKALEPRFPGEHHFRCDSKLGRDCDCYTRHSNPAFEALDWLVERCEELAEALAEEVRLLQMPCLCQFDGSGTGAHTRTLVKQCDRCATLARLEGET